MNWIVCNSKLSHCEWFQVESICNSSDETLLNTYISTWPKRLILVQCTVAEKNGFGILEMKNCHYCLDGRSKREYHTLNVLHKRMVQPLRVHAQKKIKVHPLCVWVPLAYFCQWLILFSQQLSCNIRSPIY